MSGEFFPNGPSRIPPRSGFPRQPMGSQGPVGGDARISRVGVGSVAPAAEGRTFPEANLPQADLGRTGIGVYGEPVRPRRLQRMDAARPATTPLAEPMPTAPSPPSAPEPTSTSVPEQPVAQPPAYTQPRPEPPAWKEPEPPRKRDVAEELAKSAVEAGKGSTLIYTHMPPNLDVPMGNGVHVTKPGLKAVFGDGSRNRTDDLPREYQAGLLGPKRGIFGEDNLPVTDVVEAFSFRKPEDALEFTIRHPATGQVESALRLDYVFNKALGPSVRDGYPTYPEVFGKRDVNSLVTSSLIPEPMVRTFESALRSPTMRDKAVEALRLTAAGVVINWGDIPPQLWEEGFEDAQTGIRLNRMRPPYEGLPDNHKIYNISWRDDGKGHKIAVARAV